MKKLIQYIFSISFILIMVIPLLFSNLVQGTPSEMENRMLSGIAKIFLYDGSVNQNVLTDFSNWIDDNIGFRKEMVTLNAKIQYYVFHSFTHNSNLSLGPNGELNSTPASQIIEYQHLNLLSDEQANLYAQSFQVISDYLAEKDIQYYYLQCYEKYSIYPEHMPNYIIQYGDESKTDQVVNAIKENTTIQFIDIKDDLLRAKQDGVMVYSEHGDPAHWTMQGAHIAYHDLMEQIEKNQYGNGETGFRILTDNDYVIETRDLGEDVFGDIHLIQMDKEYTLKNPTATETNDKLGEYADNSNIHFFTNDAIKNKKRVLVISDSYINLFLMNDIAESFYETVFVHADQTCDLLQWVDAFEPDILIHENAQRADRYDTIAKVAEDIKNLPVNTK